MNILIAVASRHGSTHEIAEALAQELRADGNTADVRDAGQAAVGGYDAVIVGSAVYMGEWMPEAREFVTANHAALVGVPVWLFSSGPLGPDQHMPAVNSEHIDTLVRLAGAREHRLFGGKITPHDLNLGEWLIVKMVHATESDFRDWAAISAWADEIAAELRAQAQVLTAHG